ncbi:MAG: molybdate ABC transporter substrate-binding protein [Pseudomonadota bacterium]
MNLRHSLFFLAVLLTGPQSHAADALVAVATNFAEVMEQLTERFNAWSRHHVRFTTGATGALYAQVKGGAPFDIIMAADQLRPALLVKGELAVAASRFTYATGRLTLWSPDPALLRNKDPQVLLSSDVRKVAIANPAVAPYGSAAREVIAALGYSDALANKIVMGANIGQAHAMVATRNADIGFVALSYVLSPRNRQAGSRWDVPVEMYTPIHQDAVLLNRAETNEAAVAFLAFLKSEPALDIISAFGYTVPENR